MLRVSFLESSHRCKDRYVKAEERAKDRLKKSGHVLLLLEKGNMQ